MPASVTKSCVDTSTGFYLLPGNLDKPEPRGFGTALHDHSFSPEEATALITAFETCLTKLRLTDRDDPATMTVAKVIIRLAKEGERDPERLCALAKARIAK
jgi:hypothetical protein